MKLQVSLIHEQEFITELRPEPVESVAHSHIMLSFLLENNIIQYKRNELLCSHGYSGHVSMPYGYLYIVYHFSVVAAIYSTSRKHYPLHCAVPLPPRPQPHVNSVVLGPDIVHIKCSQTSSICVFSLWVRDEIFHQQKTVGKIMILCIVIGVCSDTQYLHTLNSGGLFLDDLD
jgi:hypothetical protein